MTSMTRQIGPTERLHFQEGTWSRAAWRSGLTAVEVLVALLILTFVSVFSLHAFEYSRRLYLEAEQFDFAAQVARDILRELRSGEDWRTVKAAWEEGPMKKYTTQFDVQILDNEGEEEGVTHLEVTLSWIGPKGLVQQVLNTSVFETEGRP